MFPYGVRRSQHVSMVHKRSQSDRLLPAGIVVLVDLHRPRPVRFGGSLATLPWQTSSRWIAVVVVGRCYYNYKILFNKKSCTKWFLKLPGKKIITIIATIVTPNGIKRHFLFALNLHDLSRALFSTNCSNISELNRFSLVTNLNKLYF